MNILPKKSWHVRTKRNIERVRRDEEKAAEEEKEKQRRIALAEQEARTEVLRVRARKRHHDEIEEEPSSSAQGLEGSLQLTRTRTDISLDQGGHINFFKDIEEGLRLEGKNKEHEREKAAEKEKWEKNIGLLTYLGQSSIESQNEQPWYLKNSSSKKDQEKDIAENEKRDREVKRQQSMDPIFEMKRHLELTHKHKEKHSQKNKREAHKPSETTGKPAVGAAKSIEQLRADRMKREQEEQRRTADLMARMRGEETTEKADSFASDADRDRARRYNSQFNPDFVKPIRPRR